MKKLRFTIILFISSSYLFASGTFKSKSFEQLDMQMTAVATREGIQAGHDLRKIFEIEKGYIDYHNPCVLIITEKVINNQCPNEPTVGPFLTKGSMTCFKKESPVDIITTVMMESECPQRGKNNIIFSTKSGNFTFSFM